jgi:hypothetical protein
MSLEDKLRPWNPQFLNKALTIIRMKGWRALHSPKSHNRQDRYPIYVGQLVADLEPVLAEFLLALEQIEGRLSQIEARLDSET